MFLISGCDIFMTTLSDMN